MGSEMLQQMWMATTEMANEAKKAGVKVDKAVNLLRSAKVILNEYPFFKDANGDYVYKANELICSAQRELSLAAKPLGKEFKKKWDGKFKEVFDGKKFGDFPVPKSSKFYAGLPRAKGWVRVSVEGKLKEKIEKIKKQTNITVKPHDNKHVIIIGDKTSLRKVLDEISPHMKVEK